MTFIDAAAPIATHAALTADVHGTGAGNNVVGDDELLDVRYLKNSTDIYHSHDAAASSSADTYTKVKTITVSGLPASGLTLDVYFQLKSSTAVTTVYGRIYKNGVAAGTARTDTGGTSYAGWHEDIALENGDTVEIYLHKQAGNSNYPTAQNFRLYGKDLLDRTVGTNSTP